VSKAEYKTIVSEVTASVVNSEPPC